MASNTFIAGVVIATALLTLAAIMWREDLIRHHVFEPLEQGRTLIGLIVTGLGAWVALNSGVAWQMFIALGGIAFVVMYLYFEQPHEDIR
jgi:hypothetical protein